MTRHGLAILATLAFACGYGPGALAEVEAADDVAAITAKVHGTFLDKTGGLGVLNGDMTVVRFEVRAGRSPRSDGSPAFWPTAPATRSGGSTRNWRSTSATSPRPATSSAWTSPPRTRTCSQTAVHFDAEVAGFDSRDGTNPKALRVLCAAGELLRNKPEPEALAAALDAIAVAIRSRPAK